MEEIIKHINDTNASFRKLGAGNANNTDLFLDNEHFDFFKDAGEQITVRFNKENLEKAILFIASILPRKYDNPPTHSTIPFSVDFVYDQMAILDAFFDVDGQKVESRTQTWNVRKDVTTKTGKIDNRFYFNGLLEDVSYTNFQKEALKAKFTIRNYLAGGYSDLHFKKSEENIFDVWVTNTLVPYYDNKEDKPSAVSDKYAASFLKSALKFVQEDDNNFSRLESLNRYIVNDKSIAINRFPLWRKANDLPVREGDVFQEVGMEYQGQKYVMYCEWNPSHLEDLFFPVFNEAYKGRFKMCKENGQYNLYVISNHPLQQIYYGAPGTGKSNEIKRLTAEGGQFSKDFTFRTTFHPDSDYSTFVGAYKPIWDDEKGKIVYEFRPQAFLKAYVAAWTHPDKQVALVVEEINRGNCAQIFGDIFQLLDRHENGLSKYPIESDVDMQNFLSDALNGKVGEDWAGIIPEDDNVEINTRYSNHYNDAFSKIKEGKILTLPKNLSILATMNTSDQSLFPMDSAFKRRWTWACVPIDYNNPDSGAFTISLGEKEYNWHEFLKNVNKKIFDATQSEDKQMGNFFIDGDVDESQFINKVMFYLWNDVCKDEVGSQTNFFRYYINGEKEETKEFSFNDLFRTDAHNILVNFMAYIIKPDNAPQTNTETVSE